jgi:hypothetical protein
LTASFEEAYCLWHSSEMVSLVGSEYELAYRFAKVTGVSCFYHSAFPNPKSQPMCYDSFALQSESHHANSYQNSTSRKLAEQVTMSSQGEFHG